MKIYCIKGSVYTHGYIEKIQSIVVDEKKACYEGQGKRIKKSEIGEVTEGSSWGAFKVYVLNLEDINEARHKIKDRVIRYNEIQLNRLIKEAKEAKLKVALATNYVFDEFEIFSYEKEFK